MNTIWIAVFVISVLGLVSGVILGCASHLFAIVENNQIVEKINELLPQIQCGQCSYPSCRSYAEAVGGTQGEKINLCIPGGEDIMLKIAALINVNHKFINSSERMKEPAYMLAIINESNCIGCTKCIQVCPVDAIVGTMHSIHTVITELCIGCNLCLPLCPTQCIELRTVKIASNN